MKKPSLRTAVMLLVALLPAAYLAMIWNALPPKVPVHFGPDMQPDRMGDKAELWLPTGMLALVSMFVYFLLCNLHRIDPKRRGAQSSSTFSKLAAGLVVFMAALNVIIIESAKDGLVLQHALFPLLGLLFAFLGNYMYHIKPNYFAGLRLPWTLSSDENWRKTHQLAGKLWFAGGLLLAGSSFFLSSGTMLPVFIAVMVLITLLPVAYSFRLYKKNLDK